MMLNKFNNVTQRKCFDFFEDLDEYVETNEFVLAQECSDFTMEEDCNSNQADFEICASYEAAMSAEAMMSSTQNFLTPCCNFTESMNWLNVNSVMRKSLNVSEDEASLLVENFLNNHSDFYYLALPNSTWKIEFRDGVSVLVVSFHLKSSCAEVVFDHGDQSAFDEVSELLLNIFDENNSSEGKNTFSLYELYSTKENQKYLKDRSHAMLVDWDYGIQFDAIRSFAKLAREPRVVELLIDFGVVENLMKLFTSPTINAIAAYPEIKNQTDALYSEMLCSALLSLSHLSTHAKVVETIVKSQSYPEFVHYIENYANTLQEMQGPFRYVQMNQSATSIRNNILYFTKNQCASMVSESESSLSRRMSSLRVEG